MTNGYTQVQHSLWDMDLTMEERYMLIYLLDCENKFNKLNEWFGLTDEDFINIGFGRDKVVLRKTRNSLIEKRFISFKKGAFGKKSQYKFIRQTSYDKG